MVRVVVFSIMSFLLVACSDNKHDEAWDLISAQDCDLHSESCSSVFKDFAGAEGDVVIELDLGTKPVPIAKNFAVKVKVAGIKPEKVELDITGINMYMGFNRVGLTEVEPGVFQGNSMLAFCTNEKMVWQVGVLLHLVDGSKQLVPFELITTNR